MELKNLFGRLNKILMQIFKGTVLTSEKDGTKNSLRKTGSVEK